jgi:hypothetical protein
MALLALGLMQMSGDLLEQSGAGGIGRALRGIGAATTASPAPKVFSASQGLEMFSTRFFLEWIDRGGGHHRLALTPEQYAHVQGPYNRRNVYGAALGAGPVLSTTALTEPMFRSVARFAFCGDAPLLWELGIDPATVAGRMHVLYEPRAGTEIAETVPLDIEIPCS